MITKDVRKQALIDSLKGGLIVSCQTQKDEPIYTPDMVVVMAKCAKWAGAVGLRINSPEQIRQVKEADLGLPVIGLYKVWHDDTYVFITPTMKEVDAIVEAGADIIALDCTSEVTHEGTQAWDLIKEVRKKYPDHLILADCSNVEEAIRAVENGAELVAPTLYGYTSATQHIEGADYRMVARMCREIGDRAAVLMEGHLYTPEDAMKCIYLGCHAVVVGSAITRPHYVAKRFVDCLSGYQDDWRIAEKAHHENELK
ncbi:MAG: N-acetylmannosamine-6-phosphate 2-epimerase [Erysipelotrichaceae bacterium]|nr:N-acetylmannosamine-6-phosphate 2-epimerase [Erysipelotrichaceae bacterium]